MPGCPAAGAGAGGKEKGGRQRRRRTWPARLVLSFRSTPTIALYSQDPVYAIARILVTVVTLSAIVNVIIVIILAIILDPLQDACNYTRTVHTRNRASRII